jgi:septal ring factor EnvC (AmiA/AmiB activator)
MDREYKKLHQILLNSEQRKKEKDLITGIKVAEEDLLHQREHYFALVKYNEKH